MLQLVNVFAFSGGALDQATDVIRRAAIETVLEISAARWPGRGSRERISAPATRRTTGAKGVGCAGRPGRLGREAAAAQPIGGDVEIPIFEVLGRPS